jgi:hypothetical protein
MQFLNNDQIEDLIPAAFAETHACSGKYQQVRTADLIQPMLDAGYGVVAARQDKPTRRSSLHAIHSLTLRKRDDSLVNGLIPQIYLLNSHNGRTKLRITGGLFRLICENGLIAAVSAEEAAIIHRGNAVEDALKAAEAAFRQAEGCLETFESWKARILSPAEQTRFAEAALSIRHPHSKTFSAEELLRPRRDADVGDDLWRVFNRIQEACLAGGVRGEGATGIEVTSRPITAIMPSFQLNRSLWALAEEFA